MHLPTPQKSRDTRPIWPQVGKNIASRWLHQSRDEIHAAVASSPSLLRFELLIPANSEKRRADNVRCTSAFRSRRDGIMTSRRGVTFARSSSRRKHGGRVHNLTPVEHDPVRGGLSRCKSAGGSTFPEDSGDDKYLRATRTTRRRRGTFPLLARDSRLVGSPAAEPQETRAPKRNGLISRGKNKSPWSSSPKSRRRICFPFVEVSCRTEKRYRRAARAPSFRRIDLRRE